MPVRWLTRSQEIERVSVELVLQWEHQEKVPKNVKGGHQKLSNNSKQFQPWGSCIQEPSKVVMCWARN